MKDALSIVDLRARFILDSRGNPTVEADLVLAGGAVGRAAVPSGASTGTHEALELRDKTAAWGGLGVKRALTQIQKIISPALIGQSAGEQAALDHILVELDGTTTKKRLGANAVLAVSLAAARAAARQQNVPLSAYFARLAGRPQPTLLPVPLMNIVNGGQHAAGGSCIQEYMIVPAGLSSFSEALRAGSEIFHALRDELADSGAATTVGDEGGFAPNLTGGPKAILELIERAVARAEYRVGRDVWLALDVAASELQDENGQYRLAATDAPLTSAQMIDWYAALAEQHPLCSIEDGLGEEDWTGWAAMTKRLGSGLQLVGDDLFVTNTSFIQKGIDQGAANAVLIKPNQIGTLTETIAAVDLATRAGWRAVLSHRSGETEDTTIADLAVGLGTGQIKTGSLSRTDRVAKYNQLLRIEEELGRQAEYAGLSSLPDKS